jgi:hypothetical protein
MSEFQPCPKCQASDAKSVGFTWWGGVLGPKLLNLVQCNQCGEEFNGRTGASTQKAIRIYIGVSCAITLLILLAFLMSR